MLITSHFLPSADNYAERCEQFKNSRLCTFDDDENNSVKQNIIWLGDFNFRVDGLSVDETIE